jgi:folate-dependent phosphoribosylglycinamide formyltransferase PurN
MKLTTIFDANRRGLPMRVAAFMSGSGTNIIKLIEKEKRLEKQKGSSPFHVVFIFSDRSDGKCRGEEIAYENGIPYFSYDIRTFHRMRGLKRSVLDADGLSARREFDSLAANLIQTFEIDLIALGGYMSYTTLKGCINVHPADLSIMTVDGRRKYIGDHAVLDAIVAGETVLRSSTLWTDQGVDTGPILMISKPLKVELPEPLEQLLKDRDRLLLVVEDHQKRLKEVGDWNIFPRTIEMIAEGRFAFDEQNRVYMDGKSTPHGYRE